MNTNPTCRGIQWACAFSRSTPFAVSIVTLLLMIASSPAAGDDQWQARSSGISARTGHTVVWTGTEMIVWGGGGEGTFLRNGGRYNLATDTWQPTSLSNAPAGRWFHVAVWTGTEMIVWGGRANFDWFDNFNTGGRYDPATDTWRPMSMNGAPAPRSAMTAVWTGSEMLVWGGTANNYGHYNDGARYNPITDTWTPMTSNNAPSRRHNSTGIWTGTEMIVWGGLLYDPQTRQWTSFNTGARYNPTTDTWTPITLQNAPESRCGHTAVWTGTAMLVWGGREVPAEQYLKTGGYYDPQTDTWSLLASETAPAPRAYHAAVWTGSEMLIWGGCNPFPSGFLNTGARYSLASNTWTPMTQSNAPIARHFWRPDAGLWTGEGMLVFGGSRYPAMTESNDYYLPGEPALQAPVIVVQPQSQTVNAGADVTFAVTATAYPAPIYIWRFNGEPIPGAAAATLTLAHVQAAQAGNYSVIVTNDFGAVVSDVATLTVTSVPGCVVPRETMVSWWAAEGNGIDQQGTNDGGLSGNVTFAPGKVGTAFSFARGSHLRVPKSDSLNVGRGSGFTIEGWINPADTGNGHVIAEWNRAMGDAVPGVAFWLGHPSLPPGVLIGTIADAAGNWPYVQSGEGVVVPGAWQHVALTYDRASGNARLFVNGVQVALNRVGSFTPQTSHDLYLGVRPAASYAFAGLMDEVSLYNRALSAEELGALFASGNAGKCPAGQAPSIVQQPQSQTVNAGADVTFAVTATAYPTPTYIWRFNGEPVPDAAAATLTLAHVQAAQAGNYSVIVTNDFGAVVSDMATLTVQVPAPQCVLAPAGLVSWWAAEGNATDAVGGHDGAVLNGTGFAPGRVGQAFSLAAYGQRVTVPDAPAFQLTHSLTIEGWIYIHADGGIIFMRGDNRSGLDPWILSLPEPRRLLFRISSTTAVVDLFGSVAYQQWQHVAATLDGASGNMGLYVNGVMVASTNTPVRPFAVLDASSQPALGIGNHGGTVHDFGFRGLIDELSLYSRALSVAEIQSIYNAGSAGKCFTGEPPLITAQPQSQTVTAGSKVIFAVTATGNPPPSYQWLFNGEPIPGAVSATLTLPQVQATQAGNYSVIVTNDFGAVVSEVATLTVQVPTPQCVLAPAGLVSWWAAEGNATDAVGGHDGAVLNGAGFAPGRVGQAFSLAAYGQRVTVPDAPAFQLTHSLTIEGWIYIHADGGIIFMRGDNRSGLDPWVLSLPEPRRLLFRISSTTAVVDLFGPVAYQQWQHVAATLDGASGTMRLYVNGVMVASTNTPVRPFAALDASSQPALGIGNHGGTVHDFGFRGLIDELSLYSRALSVAEITAIVQAGSAGKCPARQAPAIVQQPQSQTVNAGAGVTFAVTATGTPPPSYLWQFNGEPIPGATAATLVLANVQAAQAGNYAVSVTNAWGAVTSSNALLTVVDTTPPTIACAPAKTVECAQAWSFDEPTASDTSGKVTVAVVDTATNAACGNTFEATRTWEATDDCGNKAQCSQTVTVVDTTPPLITCPDDLIVEFISQTGAVVRFAATATDVCSDVALTLKPASGSVFPIGLTPVLAQATDACGNSSRCTFDVTVLGARGVKENVLAELLALRAGIANGEDGEKLDEAIAHLTDSLNSSLWVDQTHVVWKEGNKMFHEEKETVKKLMDLIKSKHSSISDEVLLGFIDRLVRADRLLAVIINQEAASAGVKPKKIAEDLKEIAKGDEEAANGHADQAIQHYGNAWRHAVHLMIKGVKHLASGALQMEFLGLEGASYIVQTSTNMVDWVTMGTCHTDAEGNVQFTDPDAGKGPAQFYRVVEP